VTTGRRRLRLVLVVWTSIVSLAAAAAENSFVRGDYVAFFVTEFTAVETAPDKSHSLISGKTITGRAFSIEARWNGLTACPGFLEQWKATPRGPDKPYYLDGKILAESPMVVRMSSCMRDPRKVDRSRKDLY